MSPPGGITHLPFSNPTTLMTTTRTHNTDGHGPGPREARRAPAAHRAHGLLRAALPPHPRRLAQRGRGRHDGLCQGRSLCAGMDGWMDGWMWVLLPVGVCVHVDGRVQRKKDTCRVHHTTIFKHTTPPKTNRPSQPTNPNSPSSQDLPHAELELFRAGHDGSAEYEAYKKGRHARIGIAPVLKTSAVSAAAAAAAAANGGR